MGGRERADTSREFGSRQGIAQLEGEWPAGARFTTVHDGRTYFFCSASCQASFEADPAAYVTLTR